ncbi:MAG: aldehyde:ferredoxin oxidoreductase [Firmicutes bacterium]|nr:aldehyde:ferredoxin oxidoreductase [Bacillota bacterium]
MHRKILEIDLTTQQYRTYKDDDLFNEYLGGTGAATEILTRICKPEVDPFSPDNPIIFANGPFSNMFPVATKTAALFKSPHTGELGESHAGGRLAMAMYNAGINIMVIKGKSAYPVLLSIENDKVSFHKANTLWGKSALATYRILQEFEKNKSGKASIVRIGPAGERLSTYACATVDNQRHFGRLGLGAVMGSKNLKAFIVRGDQYEKITNLKQYKAVYDKIYKAVVESDQMKKYHDMGTAENILPLNMMGGLPTRNFTQGFFESAEEISGETFAVKTLVQKIACAHCQCGCIHLSSLREQFGQDHSYKTFQISYDYELIYAMGSNLSINSTDKILRLLHIAEKQGWDVMSLGVTLAWLTEAYIHGLLTKEHTDGLDIHFGDGDTYIEILRRMTKSHNELYRDLEKGASWCAEKYGGSQFALTFGKNEAPGYMTGENAFTDWLLGVRHSHLDGAGYSVDQALFQKALTVEEQVKKLVDESVYRMLSNSLVICLFARKVYDMETILEGLEAVGEKRDPQWITDFTWKVFRKKYEFKKACGLDFDKLTIPEKLYHVTSATGKTNRERIKERIEIFRKLTGV